MKSSTASCQYCASTHTMEESADYIVDRSTSSFSAPVWAQVCATGSTPFFAPFSSNWSCLVQAAQQHVPQDANLVLSQDELKLGERLILHLRSMYSS